MRIAAIAAAVWLAAAASGQDVSEWEQARDGGRAAFQQGRYGEAEPLLSKALVMAQQLPPDPDRVAGSLHDLAGVHRATGQHKQAEELLRAALILREKQSGPTSMEVLPEVEGIAWTLYGQGKLAEAAVYFRRALAILDASGTAEPGALITAALNLARVAQPLKEDAEVVALLERVIRVREQWRGEGHPELASDRMRLGRHHGAQKRPAEAEREFLRALGILEKANGPMNASLTAPLDELGALYAAQKRFEDAEPLLRRSVTVREWTNGPLSADLAPALENLAAVWVELKRLEDAERAYSAALALWQLKLGPEHPLLGNTLDRLGSVCAAQLKFEKAAEYFRHALAIRDKDEAANLNNLALVLAAQEKRADAEPYYKVALAVIEKPAPAPKGGDPEMLKATLENYRDLLAAMGQKPAAARLAARLKTLEAQAKPSAKQ
ncbi:MAG TPA: tetratricopeptide repeat protein [Roseiflexaceae bacterium]